MQSEYEKLETKIQDLKKQIEELPTGNLVCARNGKNYKWYKIESGNKTYIPKEKRLLAEQLAIKKYLSLLLEDVSCEKNAIQFYLNHHSDIMKSEELLNIPEYKTLLASYFTPVSEELTEWINEDYERNIQYPEHLIHKSSSGNLVRSKSESIIDMLLYINKIPFRYECVLKLGEVTLYPDFTIRHPKTGDVYYWEHFGLMDNPDYAKNTFSKLQLYAAHDIFPNIKLITTYETKECPLSLDAVEKIIKHYFL